MTQTAIFRTEDAHRLARRRLPRLIFDFIDGGTGREMALRRNTARFDEIMLQPRIMAPPAQRDLTTRFLDRDYALPFGIAPMGMCNLSWPNADQLLAQAARSFEIPLTLSSAASSSLEDMRGWAGDKAWFQLYVSDPLAAESLVARAADAGYDHLVLSVDVPQVARRWRDLRNGFEMPFRLGLGQMIDFATHPIWSLLTLWHGVPELGNFRNDHATGRFDRHASRAGADWAFLDRLRELWHGKLIVKGVTEIDDAIRVKASGADAIYVSNHGGRQLDSVPAAIDLLPRIRSGVGVNYPLIFDSGVRGGEDIIKAFALGADFVMVGRPLLYALGAEAGRGLTALIRIFAEEIGLTLAQLGLSRIDQIDDRALARKRT